MRPNKRCGEKCRQSKNRGSKSRRNIAAIFTGGLMVFGLITALYAARNWRKQTRLSGKFNFPSFIYFIHIPSGNLFLGKYMNEVYEQGDDFIFICFDKVRFFTLVVTASFSIICIVRSSHKSVTSCLTTARARFASSRCGRWSGRRSRCRLINIVSDLLFFSRMKRKVFKWLILFDHIGLTVKE